MKNALLLLIAFTLTATALEAQVKGNNDYNAPAPATGNYNYRDNYNYNYNIGNYTNTAPNRQAASGAAVTDPGTVSIAINGLMNLVADDYVAIFNIVQVGVDITETDDLMNARIKLFKHKLQNYGIDSAEVKVDMISFVPKYSIEVESKLFSKSNNEVPAGFELQKNVMVHFKNSSKVDDIVSAAAQAEIYDLVKVDYTVTDLEKCYDTLMQACVAEVKEKVKLYEGLGFRLDTVRKAVTDNFTTVFPSQRYYTYQAFSRPSIPLTRKGAVGRLNETDKSTSRYYNQVEVDQYNVVLHPLITEPVVQLSYSINVQYYLTDPKPVIPPKNNYFIITETGEVKQIFPGK